MSEPNPARPPSPRLLVLGLVLAVAGATAVICRYAFIPSEMDALREAALVGGPLAMAASGFAWIRRALNRGQRLSLRGMGLAVLVPSLVVTVAYAVGSAPQGPEEASLQAWTVPGLRVGLPGWEPRRVHDEEVPGEVSLEAPGGGRGSLELRWARSPSADEPLRGVGGSAGLETVDERDARVDGRRARTAYMEGDGDARRAASTSWRCGESGLSFRLTISLSRSKEDVLALQRRVLDTVDCASLTRGELPEPVHPRFEPPEGYASNEAGHTRVWEGEDGDLFDVAPGTPGRHAARTLDDTPQARARSARSVFGLEALRFRHEAITARGPDGEARDVQVGQGRDRHGSPVRILMTWRYCANVDRSFVAFHAGSADLPVEPRARALAGLRCPE